MIGGPPLYYFVHAGRPNPSISPRTAGSKTYDRCERPSASNRKDHLPPPARSARAAGSAGDSALRVDSVGSPLPVVLRLGFWQPLGQRHVEGI